MVFCDKLSRTEQSNLIRCCETSIIGVAQKDARISRRPRFFLSLREFRMGQITYSESFCTRWNPGEGLFRLVAAGTRILLRSRRDNSGGAENRLVAGHP